MQFLFLGTGTSAGIPVIACDCAACTSHDPRDTRLRTGAAVRWTDPAGQERVVLLDATPDLRVQALRHNIRRCDAILFTHNHVDHIFGLDEVRRFNAVMQAPIAVYAEPDTMDALHRVYQHIFQAEHNVNRSFVATLHPAALEPGRPVDLFGMRFTPVRLQHGRLPIVGFRIEPAPAQSIPATGWGEPLAATPLTTPWAPLAYCTDVSAIPAESWPLLEGLETLVLDALRWKHHPTHLTIDQAISVADRVGAKRTWFVHMAHQVKHAETEERLPSHLRLAYDGLTL